MKKLIFLLLCTVSIYGQTTTGQEQEFDYGIKNNSAQTITTPPYLTTTGMDGTQGKIPSALIEKTDNKQNSLAIDVTGTKYPTVDAVNTGLALKALDSNVVHKTGNETVAGVKTFSSNIKLQTGILELNNSDDNGYGSILLNYNRFLFKDKTYKTQFLIEEGNFSTYKTSSILGRFVNSDLTATRNYGLPDASGTIALISQTVTNGVTTSSPSQDAVYDFVTANAVTLGTTNGLILSGQQISLGLSSTSTIGALSSTDWNVFNNKENAFSKNTAFNKNFGTTAGTVAEGNDSRILNGQTAFGWGNHASAGYALTTGSNINQSSFRTALGLGSNAYTSTAYLPLSGGTISGNVNVTGVFNGASGTFSSKVSTVGVASVIESNGGFTTVSSNVNNDNTSFKIMNSSASKVYAFTAGKQGVSHDGFGLWNVTDNTYPVWVEPSGDVSLNANTTVSGTVSATSYTGSATLTGTPTAPTAAPGTNTTQIATTAFVQANKNKLRGYTVATLPAGTIGDMAYVTDASGFSYNTVVVGGGSGVTIVFFDGTNWRAH